MRKERKKGRGDGQALCHTTERETEADSSAFDFLLLTDAIYMYEKTKKQTKMFTQMLSHFSPPGRHRKGNANQFNGTMERK